MRYVMCIKPDKLYIPTRMCIPTAILTPRLGNDFSLSIAENINPTKMEIFSYMLKFEYPYVSS